MKEEGKTDHIKTLLVAEVRSLCADQDSARPLPAQSSVATVTGTTARNSERDFFDFEMETTDSFTADTEVTDYLKSSPDMQSLNTFPRIKQICLKYNTSTPSSAPVERLFSLGGLVLTPKRNRLSDRRFERLLLLRFNHHFQ